MTVQNDVIRVASEGFTDIFDLTNDVRAFVQKYHFKEGQLLVFINGSTAAISTVEYEPGLLQDIPALLEKLIPAGQRYKHDDTWHDGNGYAHLRSTLIGTSLVVPVINSRLQLGTWQQIILLDFDNKPRTRQVILQYTGV